jgi:hypothetical protein
MFMRILVFPLAAVLSVSMIGCQSQPKPHPDDHAEANRAMVQWLNNAAIDNAIIRQHTLYPYHFVANSEKLNDLGYRDVMVLGNFYRMNPGKVNVRKADTPDGLYEARIDYVVRALEHHGVSRNRIEVVEDGFPGGDGASSQRVMQILELDRPGQRSSPTAGARQTRGLEVR